MAWLCQVLLLRLGGTRVMFTRTNYSPLLRKGSSELPNALWIMRFPVRLMETHVIPGPVWAPGAILIFSDDSFLTSGIFLAFLCWPMLGECYSRGTLCRLLVFVFVFSWYIFILSGPMASKLWLPWSLQTVSLCQVPLGPPPYPAAWELFQSSKLGPIVGLTSLGSLPLLPDVQCFRSHC